MKTKRRGSILLYCMVAVGLLGTIFAGYQMYAAQAEYRKNDAVYEQLRTKKNKASSVATPTPAVVMPSAPVQASSLAAMEDLSAPINAEASAVAPTATPFVSQMDFAPLTVINQQTVAWITLPDTVIDYPVVQGMDNEYYLTHLFTGEKGKAGSIFMDARNKADFTDKNTILFGHHLRDGSMFAGINNYYSKGYYEDHPVMQLYSPAGDYTVAWFAGYHITSSPIPVEFASEAEFMAFVSQAYAQSDFESGVQAQPSDRIVTLCTCAYVQDDARYLLMGVLR